MSHPTRMIFFLILPLLGACAHTGATKEANQPAEASIEVVQVAPAEPMKVALQDNDVYRYFGYNDASTSPAGRSVFQDFSYPNGTVGGTWSDPDSEHRKKGQSWVKPRISRRTGAPFLAVDFSREGHGANVNVLPKEGTPLPIPAGKTLVFQLRSMDDACAGLRLMERDGEVWAFGKLPLEYKLLCPDKSGEWTDFAIPLDPSTGWFKFPYDGNHQLGNNQAEMDLLVDVTFELGFEKGDYLGKGVGRLDIGPISIQK